MFVWRFSTRGDSANISFFIEPCSVCQKFSIVPFYVETLSFAVFGSKSANAHNTQLPLINKWRKLKYFMNDFRRDEWPKGCCVIDIAEFAMLYIYIQMDYVVWIMRSAVLSGQRRRRAVETQHTLQQSIHIFTYGRRPYSLSLRYPYLCT